MSYFKTNDQAALAAVNKFFDDKQILHEQAMSFAALFSAEKPIFYHSSNDCWLGGLIFKPAQDDRFWTKPDRKDRTQRPRTKVAKMTDTEAQAHKKQLEQWENEFPKMRPSKDAFYKAIGTDWSNVMFGGGLGFFVLNDCIYIETNLTLGKNVTEILGSEYKAAKTAFEAANKEDATA